MTTTTQPRQPAGSPQGGQFTTTPGGEEGDTLHIRDLSSTEVVLCVDCAVGQEYENPDPNYASNSCCPTCWEEERECDHEGHIMETFSTTPCDKCGTNQAGERFHYTYWHE